MGSLPSSPEQSVLEAKNISEKSLQQQSALSLQPLPSVDAQTVQSAEERQQGALARSREELSFSSESERADQFDQFLPRYLLTPGDLRMTEEKEIQKEDLEAITQSEMWKNLVPNYERPDALFPADLSADQLQALITSVSISLPHIGSDESMEKRSIRGLGILARLGLGERRQGKAIPIPGLGTLSYLGSGERKQGYLLTTPDGKKMTVLINNAYSLRLHIPADPHIAFDQQYVASSDNGRVTTEGSYSTFRTYLSIPRRLGNAVQGIQLMEYGGKPAKKVDRLLIPRMVSDVLDRGFQLREPDDASQADKPEHFLSKHDTGTTGIIDIGVTNRYQGEKEIKAYYRGILGQEQPEYSSYKQLLQLVQRVRSH